MENEQGQPRGNGTSGSSAAWRLYESSEAIRREMRGLGSAFSDAAKDVENMLRQQMASRPYTTLAAAAGVGYIIGGGMASRLTRTAMGIAGRFALAVAARELSMIIDLPDRYTPAAGPETGSI